MVGADEKTVCDKFWNTVFVTGGQGADERVARYVQMAESIGFTVEGNQIMASKAEIHSAMRVWPA